MILKTAKGVSTQSSSPQTSQQGGSSETKMQLAFCLLLVSELQCDRYFINTLSWCIRTEPGTLAIPLPPKVFSFTLDLEKICFQAIRVWFTFVTVILLQMLNLKIQLKIQYFKLGLISFHPT